MEMNLEYLLENCLPEGKDFEVLHLQNPPIETHPVITSHPKLKNLKVKTIKNQHFLVLFHQKKAVYALEVYVYLSLSLCNTTKGHAERFVFVSKADTSGYCDCHVSFKRLTKQFIEYLLSIDPSYYLNSVIPRHPVYPSFPHNLITNKTSTINALRILSKRSHDETQLQSHQVKCSMRISIECPRSIKTKVALFTRPSPHYVFAGSSKNAAKHLLDGSSLLKWWLSILDEILLEFFEENAEAKLRIPGEEQARVRRYLNALRYKSWEAGDIYTQKATELAAFTIPLFPDDPKSRFLHQLVNERRINSTSCETFWTELQERQEFRLSDIVSVIGIEGFTKATPSYRPTMDEIILASTKKQFKCIKCYVTGEEYDTVDGAVESYLNVRDYIKDRLGRPLLRVRGSARHQARSLQQPNQENCVSILQVRKKLKR